MPARKSSPSKAKKSPAKTRSKSRSRSRSRSAARKPSSPRSRSRSASRKARHPAPEVQQKSPPKPSTKKSPARSPGRPKNPPRTTTPPRTKTPTRTKTPPPAQIEDARVEAEIIPTTRVSRRVQERTIYQVTKSSVTSKGDAVKVTSATVKEAVTASPAAGTGPGYMGGLLVPFVIFLTYYIVMSCTKSQCELFKLPKCDHKWQSFLNLEVTGITFGFYVVMGLLALVPIGAVVQGQPLRDGKRLEYRCNGWFTLLVVAAAFGYSVQRGCPMDYVHQHFLQFLTAGVIFSLLMTLSILICGRNSPMKDRCPGSDGTFLNDFWMGRELNPRCGQLDLKQVMFRSCVVAWLLIDWMYLAHQFKSRQTAEPALALVVLFHTLYCFITIKNEHTAFTSTDFMVEGFGYMFSWACTCFLPIACPLQARYLYLYPTAGITNNYALGGIFLLNAMGLIFFTGSNWQKNEFRNNPYNPELSHLTSIPTATGKRLLCSGWWGIVRRPNYLGDLMTALAWSLLCGWNSGLPYFYPVYLVILLVARVLNDEKSCHQRYGDAWVKYTEVVPYRLIPYVF